ncbi:Krueppel homologous protein 1 [Anoplolepis gracilipes]|uniref:Krueppel homologous protein 1 n=1 Tax=Anoplolepis gracilipes TaxID=354296 RepID=UPI003B9EA0BD
MLGYYQTESMANSVMSMPGSGLGSGSGSGSGSGLASAPSGGMTVGLEAMSSVKSLVCSPDLTMFTTPRCSGVETTDHSASPTTADCSGKYQCLVCRKNFAQKSVYQSHLRSHGKEGEDPYRCNICGKTFAVPARLTRHYRTHTGEKPYQCEYCSKSFSVKENLSVHRRIHTKERPYKCDVCGRAFEHSGKLHRHMRIHTGERPHKCSVCAKTFIQSGQLVIHMRTHTGEKPYVCESCKKGFTCSKQLKVHTRTHTGEKPYTCEICRKAFGYNHVLKLHQVSHYGEKVYKCTICNETFNSKKTMELHIKKHPESPTSLTSTITDNGIPSPSAPVRHGSPIEPDIEISQGGAGAGSKGNSLGSAVVPASTQGLLGIAATDDKENHMKTEEAYPDSTTSPYAVQRDLAYYLYSGNREQQYSQPVTTAPAVNAAETVLADIEEKRFQASVVVSTPLEPATHHHVFFYPEPAYTSFALTPGSGVELDPADCSSLLNLPGNDARRRVEAALKAVEGEHRREEYDCVGIVKIDQEPLLTPPSSNPDSPASSPDLALDLAIPPRETLILPPRKRSKMILQSMESEYRSSGLIAASQRQNSVIQFARAS